MSNRAFNFFACKQQLPSVVTNENELVCNKSYLFISYPGLKNVVDQTQIDIVNGKIDNFFYHLLVLLKILIIGIGNLKKIY